MHCAGPQACFQHSGLRLLLCLVPSGSPSSLMVSGASTLTTFPEVTSQKRFSEELKPAPSTVTSHLPGSLGHPKPSSFSVTFLSHGELSSLWGSGLWPPLPTPSHKFVSLIWQAGPASVGVSLPSSCTAPASFHALLSHPFRQQSRVPVMRSYTRAWLRPSSLLCLPPHTKAHLLVRR